MELFDILIIYVRFDPGLLGTFLLVGRLHSQVLIQKFCRKSALSLLNFPLLGHLEIVVTGSCSWGESFVTVVAASSSGVDDKYIIWSASTLQLVRIRYWRLADYIVQ